MTLPTTGPLSASMVNVELLRAANAPFSLKDTTVRALAGKPSGPISFADLRGKSSEIVVNLTSRAAVCLQDLFTPADWASAFKKRVVIPAGVEIGGTNVDWALVPAWDATGQTGSWVGDLVLDNRGVISGQAGAANSGRGGNCIRAIFGGRSGQKLQLINSGTIRSGGGGGGRGGNGGGGYYDTPSTVRDPASGDLGQAGQYSWYANANAVKIWWGGAVIYDATPGAGVTQLDIGGWTYYRGATYGPSLYRLYRQQTVNTRTYTSGGAGGNGGKGIGYGAAAGAGANGAAGGTNAGTGGRGGNGGGWGAAGAGGATGSSGNNGAGTGGTAGGPAGYTITGLSFVQVVQNTGTITGPTV